MLPSINQWYLSSIPLTLLHLKSHYSKAIQTKTGDQYNGHLISCDNFFLNIVLRNVYHANADQTQYWKLDECHIRGSSVKISISQLG
ncbi:U6 snRNA-associated Sm-like protein LSm4 [Termitomyces sp. J132]|nr:U6 snRNA-associated Sm-like protein LSm4 [Termitomyces sp. J132]